MEKKHYTIELRCEGTPEEQAACLAQVRAAALGLMASGRVVLLWTDTAFERLTPTK